MVILGCHDRNPFRLCGLGQSEVDLVGAGDPVGEIAFERVTGRRQSRQMENGSLHERSTRLAGRVLIERDDIRSGAGQKCADCGDQTRPIRAAQQQSADIAGR